MGASSLPSFNEIQEGQVKKLLKWYGMTQQLQALRKCQPTTDSHLEMTPFQESEDIQDFLEAFEGIIR